MGEWNEYMPEIMERYRDEEILLDPELANTFFYKTKLFRGFRYRYNFNVGEQFVIDSAKGNSEDRSGKLLNHIDVCLPNQKDQAADDDDIDEEELKDTLNDLANDDEN